MSNLALLLLYILKGESLMKKVFQILALGLFSISIACSNKSTSVNANNSTDRLPAISVTDLEDSNFQDNRVTFGLELDSNLTGYESIDLSVYLESVTGNGLDSRYGGDVVSYIKYENGEQGVRFFTSGLNVAEDVQENYWYYSRDNQYLWRGVFEGARGALIIVIDGVYSSGDGAESRDLVSGSVWLRPWPDVADPGVSDRPCVINESGNVDCKNPSAPPQRCWNVSLGPYDCRFEISDDAQTVQAIGNQYTDQEYIKIGTFSDLSRKETFNEE